MPNTVAPRCVRWAWAWVRATVTGRRITDAADTEALSMMRLMTIASTAGVTSTGSAAISAIFQARCSERGNSSALRRVRTSCVCMIRTVRSWLGAQKPL